MTPAARAGLVAWITIAPVKGLGLVDLPEVDLGPDGVAANRRFLLVDTAGSRVNGKHRGELVQVHPDYDPSTGRLALHFPDGRVVEDTVRLGAPVEPAMSRRRVPGRVVDGPYAGALSEWAGVDLQLVALDRPGDGVDRGREGSVTILSTGSLDALSAAAGVAVDRRRFRMLFGVTGVPAYAEDGWLDLPVRVGEAVVVPHRRVGRCVVTTQDPDTGETDLDTLRLIRRLRPEVSSDEGLPLGVWGAVAVPGRVRVGDPVAVG